MLNKCLDRLIFSLIILVVGCFFPSTVNASILFQDDFNDGNADGWLIARNTCSSENEWEVKDGKFGIAINSSGCVTEAVPSDNLWNTSWGDYIIETDIIVKYGVDANIAFRYGEAQDPTWYGYHFQFNINPVNTGITLQRVFNTNLYNNFVNHYLAHNVTYHLKIIVDGDQIQLFIDDNLVLDYPEAGNRFPVGKLALQASVGSVQQSEVWFDNIVVRSIDDVPTGNIPVVFLPGMGGSWNTTAMITGGDSTDWKKTPFIKVYDNLRDTFLNNGYSEGDDYFEFYYDWRDSPDEIADNFKNYLENTVLAGKDPNTKVNIACHSMGGLVARAYAQKYGDSKINKLVTSGSPHQGTIPAWFGWSGAEVGDRWSWEWIALQLYLQIHKDNYTSPISAIHALSPSLQELQPTFDFTKDSQDQVIGVQGMSDFNNYLFNLNNNLEASLESLMITIAGINNTDSVEWIKLKDRSLTDRLLSKWPDGQPDSFEYTDEGDLTVLRKSALIDGVDQTEVSNTHQGIVQSDAGIQSILDGLELTFNPVTGISIPNRNPSLVFFLHSPADIKVTAPDGSQVGHGVVSPMGNAIYSALDKLLIIYDAVDGDYQVEVIGSDLGSYSLDLGQLTQTGEKWTTAQETINNGETDTYTLSFNSNNPKDFPLTDVTGKMQLGMARVKLSELMDYINSQSFSLTNKRQLTRRIDRLIRMIDKAISYIETNGYSRAYRYAKAAMTGCYSLRMKVDQLGRGGRIDVEVRAKIKSITHEAGLLSMEGFIATLDQTGRGPNQSRVNREVSVADRVKIRTENRIASTSGENHALGQAFSLSQEMLSGGQSALDSGEYSRASAQALLSRLLSLETSKIR